MESQVNFVFAMVARGMTPLAEYPLGDRNFQAYAERMLSSTDPKTPNAFAEQNNFLIVTHSEPDGMNFLLICQNTITASIRQNFLKELQQKWRQKCPGSAEGFEPHSKNADFGSIEIHKLLDFYNSQSFGKIAAIAKNLDDAKEQMDINLTMAYDRGDQLEDMDKKAENIKKFAGAFKDNAGEIRRKLSWQKWRFYVYVAIILIVFIFLIIVIACGGFTFKKCKKEKK